jgi:hypothetical protein
MSEQETPLDPVDEFTQSFLDAMDKRFPVTSSADPSPETTPVAPGDEQPVEGQEPSSPESAPEVPAEAPREPEPEPEGEPEEGEAPPAEPAQSAPAFTLSGVDYSNEQISQAIQVHDWFARLNPNQVQAIDALMSGQYRLEPVQAVPQTPAAAGTPATSPSTPAPAAEDEGEWLDPRAQHAINALRSQIDELKQNVNQSLTPVVQTQQQADYNARLTAINTAHSSFQSKYGLADDAMQALEAAIAEAQILPGLTNRTGSLEAGMNTALEMMFWTTPTYRDPYVRSRNTSEQVEQAEEQAANVRKQHLTALSGSGGSVPRREPVPSNPEDRHAAMVSEIAAAMNGSGQVQ